MSAPAASGPSGRSWVGAWACLLWLLFVWRWFDVGEPLRPAWLEAVPAPLLAVPALLLVLLWLRQRSQALRFPRPVFLSERDLRLPVLLALLFRLPFVGEGAAGAVTPDGALSGIVMLRILKGTEHLVFVPHVPYSGSLKSHLAALLAQAFEPARAFALASVFFYALFVAAVVRLAALLPGASRASVLAAGLYAAFAPPFVTRYSLSNDGNYVEVLALGAWALVFAARFGRSPRPLPAFAAGALLGLAFWCHILAVIPLAAVVLALVLFEARAPLRSLPALALGWVLGNAPGLLWNLANGGESFRYLLPGGVRMDGEEAGPGPFGRLLGLVGDHLVVLFGYDPGYGARADAVLRLFGGLSTGLVFFSVGRALAAFRRQRDSGLAVLLLFSAVNVGVALLALPYIPGNARYVLFLAGPCAVLLGWALTGVPWGRAVLAALIAAGAVASLAQLPGTARADGRWRTFVADLEAAGVRFCYTDFHLATKINFLSSERVVCSAKLGPTTTEYFFDYRKRVEAAPAAALLAVNPTAAGKLERRLRALRVAFERRDLMKPVLLPSRKVDPQELFPGRPFPLR